MTAATIFRRHPASGPRGLLWAMAVLFAAPSALAAEPTPISLRGKIRQVAGGPGGRPQALLVTAGGERALHALDAGFREELLRLTGVVVKVTGVTNDPRTAAPEDILVKTYEIIEVAKGVVPRVGFLNLREVDNQRRLVFEDREGRTDPLPKGWSRKLRKLAGAKVWIVGRRDRLGRFRPARFAVLRPPPPTAAKTTGPLKQ